MRNIVIAVCVTAVAVVGAFFGLRQASAQPVEVYPVSNISSGYWGSQNIVQGAVSEGRSQTVPLRDATVAAINVTAGQQVKKGDVLVTYDTTSFALTVQKDEASIAVLEADIARAEQEVTRLGSLQPSENAPQPTYQTIDHGALVLQTRLDGTPEDGATYSCSTATVVSSSFLKALREGGSTVTLLVYEVGSDGSQTLFGGYELSGGELPRAETTYEYDPVEDAPSDAEGQEAESPQSAQETLYRRMEAVVDPLDEDWTLGDGISFTGDGVSVSTDAPRFGTFTSQTPEAYQRYETVEVDPPATTGDNYAYSRSELASLIKEQQETIQSKQLDLREARLTLQKDQLTAESGEVTSAIDGVVLSVADPAAINVGDTLVEVGGGEDYTVTLYVDELELADVRVGDAYDVSTWQSGQYFEATVAEIGDTPVDGNWSYGDANPNTSWYPVTCTVTVEEGFDLDLSVGEGCEATSASAPEQTDAIYLEQMYVRTDEQGPYVMAAGSDGLLERRAVTTGHVYYGSVVEVLSGVTEDDRIAFPYGTDVVAGARTVDADYPDNY